MSEAVVYGWHFLPKDGRTRWKTGRWRRIIKPGVILHVRPPLRMCSVGLHGSIRATDALNYAPGPIVSYVGLYGELLRDNDKVCAEYRRVFWVADASEVLHEFACKCATRALKGERRHGREPDPRSWAAIKAKRGWLTGKVTNDELAAAGAAAGAAQKAAWAAQKAAWEAAEEATWAAQKAAGEAAQEATWAARAAARAAAGDAAWDKERAWQNRTLTKMLKELKP